MKAILIISAVLAFVLISFAQTHIAPGNVSGTWALSGSPYFIEGEISIPSGQTLTIEPGVLVKFQGHYTLFVQGRLIAVGTETNLITFTINDTTGFYNPNSPLGGWYGIRFVYTPVQNDTSKIIYCKLQYSKALGTDWTLNAGGAICLIDFDKVKISNSNFSYCSATRAGGGIYIWKSELRMTNSNFQNNWATLGGGIAGLNSALSLDNCMFSKNHAATNSGAIDFDFDTLISPIYQFNAVNSRFIENSANQYYGAIKILQPETGVSLVNVFIDKCEFDNNSSTRSGAIRLDGNIQNFVISNSSFSRNIAGTQSACAFWRGASGKIYNCLFDSNITLTGLGSLLLSNNSNVDFINCTIVNNIGVTSGGLKIQNKSTSKVINSIFWGNYPDQISLQSPDASSVSSIYLNYNDIQFGIDSIKLYDPISVLNWGVGNIDSYPVFLDTLNSDYHLQNVSPCIGTGIDSIEIEGMWYYCPLTDIEGNPRPGPVGSMPDMGAYESPFPVGIEDDLGIPSVYALYQNFPNPFNPGTKISWQSPVGSHQAIKVFDVLGNEIATLVDEYKPAGKYEIEFNAEKLSSGIYFYQLKVYPANGGTGSFVETKKMILLR